MGVQEGLGVPLAVAEAEPVGEALTQAVRVPKTRWEGEARMVGETLAQADDERVARGAVGEGVRVGGREALF